MLINSHSKKTFILAWTYQPNNKRSDDTNNFWGLGDIIRGAISMFQLSKKYDFTLIVDLQHHSLSKYLKFEPHKYSHLLLENKHNIPFIEDWEIESYLQNNTNDVSLLFTNCHLRGEVTEDCKEFIKNILTPTNEFQHDINQILHFRLGDSSLVRNQTSDYSNMIVKMNEWREENDILMSDSKFFKDEVKKRNINILLLDTIPTHLGYKNHSDNIKDTLLEFFIATQSQKIKTYSIYDWISGFVNIVHQIYDIPIIKYS